jgi:hypothetical protein
MRVSKSTITKLSQLIVEKPYRSRHEIVRFFEELGLPDLRTSSRTSLAEEQLDKINSSAIMERAILNFLSPGNFLDIEDTQENMLARLNIILHSDGYKIERNTEGLIEIIPTSGSSKLVKNIIFASSGPKPDLGFSDALNNDIQILSNAEYCLIYEEPVKNNGLWWSDLVKWWAKREGKEVSEKIGRALYARLYQSIPETSKPAQIFFKTYYSRKKTTSDIPALLPEVYLHYDPKTRTELKGEPRLIRQRMDFLLLLPKGRRIVIEIDGVQHYSENGKPNPQKYGEMVSEDRKLKLAGYDVYRFGGYEFLRQAESLVEGFFDQLFVYYRIDI